MWFLPLFVLVWFSEAKSSGIITTSDIAQGCDWEAPGVIKAWGCQTRKWNASNDFSFARGFCQDANFNTGKFMWWTGAPENASPTQFSMRTGNGDPAKDPKTYVAGRYVSVYINALQFDNLYKGLLLFAKEDKGTNGSKVGDWIVPLEESPQFASYPTQLCQRSVMHVNAEDKPYVAKFNFVAPPSGTGTIRIKAILKTGPPNPTDYGSFLILPDIVLTEAQPQDTRKWVLLNGTSCADYCVSSLQELCNDAALGTSMDGIQPDPLDSIYPCHGARFHDCSGNPRVVLPDRFCTYAGSDCPKPTAAKCSVVPDANTPMFCLCGAPITGAPTKAPTVPGPTSPTNPNVLQAGSSSSLVPRFGALISVILMGLLNGQYSATLGLAALMLGAAPLASAHNWMEGTRGRASNLGANQFCSPAFPQVTRQKVHMQVAAGQPFVLEWASAHGDSTYWVLIHDDARSNVSKLTRTLMNNWLNACPGGGLGNLTGTGRKYHRFKPNKNLQSTGTVNGASANAQTYAEIFYPDPIYNGSIWDAFSLNGGRPDTFYSKSPGMINCGGGDNTVPGYNCSAGPRTMLAKYREFDLVNDRRCAYTNDTNPWIHAIHRYTHRDVNDGYATALMTIPDHLPAGRYQLHYKWSSYCDTIDIDVKAKGMTVVNPYGTPVAPVDIEYDIAHHCLFEKPRKVGQCVEVVTTPQQCAALCNTDTNCRGFQLLPLQLDNSNGNSFGLFPEASYIPWTDVGKSNLSSFCEKSQFVDTPKAGSMVCFTVTQFQNDFNSARPLWAFTEDTNHQGFYGTCYIKPVLRDFGDIALVAADTHTDFQFLSKCIPCDNIGQDLSNPRWGPQLDYCTDCSKTTTKPRSVVQAPQWAATIGPGTFNQTSHWLSPGGTPYAFEDECKILAQRNPLCSKWVMYSDHRAQRFAGRTTTRLVDVMLSATRVVRLINQTTSWHYSRGTLDHSYFRTCACLDKEVADNLAGASPVIDKTMFAKACEGATSTQCVFRNFTIFQLP